MHVVRKLNRLGWGYLGLVDPPTHSDDQQSSDNNQTQLNQALFQELDDKFAHANSSYSIEIDIVQPSPEVDPPNGIRQLSCQACIGSSKLHRA